MIVRILGEGQFKIDDVFLQALNVLDNTLQIRLESGHEAEFAEALNDMLTFVRQEGDPVPADALETSHVILPPQGASLGEVRNMISEEGFIPD